MNPTANAILNDAINQLDRGALEQIAHHCEHHIALAKSYSVTHAEKIALIHTPAREELERLATTCRRILAMG